MVKNFYRAEILHAVVSADGPELVHVGHQGHTATCNVHALHVAPTDREKYKRWIDKKL